MQYYNGLSETAVVSTDKVKRYLWTLALVFPHRVNVIWAAQSIHGELQEVSHDLLGVSDLNNVLIGVLF